MSRYISFRDFDWLLFTFVLVICGLGVMEIHSATTHTKFAGAHIRQVYWILGGIAGMFLHRFPDERNALRSEISGRPALGQNAGGSALSAF
jgi:cell division protein FtsW (lipid II flippase)